MALVLKGIFSEIRYVCVLTSSVLDRGGDNFTPPPPTSKGTSKKPTYNRGYNILELYNVLIQTRSTTSKTKRDI